MDLLYGWQKHGFLTLQSLQVSLTLAFDSKRWLSNEEICAMLLNPDPFRFPGFLVDDRGFTTDAYFFIFNQLQYVTMCLISGPSVSGYNKWPYYDSDVLIPGFPRHELLVGIKKNKKLNRGPQDFREVVCGRWEVKGKWRCRRRTMLPDDFEETTGIPNPYPGLMVIQYMLCPDAVRSERVQIAAVMEASVAARRQNFGTMLVPLHDGPARPAGILPQLIGHNIGPGLGHGAPVPGGVGHGGAEPVPGDGRGVGGLGRG